MFLACHQLVASSMSQVSVDEYVDQIRSLPLQKQRAIVNGIEKAIQKPTELRTRRPKGSQPMFWHNTLVYFLPNNYVAEPYDVWCLDSILGANKVSRIVKRTRLLDNDTVEKLFARVPFSFYTNASETYLVSARNELTEADFGPLQPIKAIDALKRFGLERLEIAKEKGHIRLQR